MKRRVRTALLGSLCVTFTVTGAAQAEHCAGLEERPAVCTVDFYGAFAGQRLSRFDPDGALELPPAQTLEIELEALDQHRRRFPENRLAFDFYDDDCRGLVEVVETGVGRYKLRAGGRQGECDLWLWVPGNLNLEWRLVLRAVPRGRGGYSRAEAEFVAQRLYLALLGREAEPGGLRDTAIEIQSGNLEGRTLDMLRSSEYRSQDAGRTPTVLLEQIYDGIFGRKPDSDGVRAFLPLLQRGQTAIVIRELMQSEEFEAMLAKEGSEE